MRGGEARLCRIDQRMIEPALLHLILERPPSPFIASGAALKGSPWGHRRTPFRLSNPLRRYRRGPDSPKRNHSFDTNVTASLSHRTFHKQYQERDRKRHHGHHPEAVEIGKR